MLQDMLRDEFGMGQQGKRLKFLEAVREEAAATPKPNPKSKPKKSIVAEYEPLHGDLCGLIHVLYMYLVALHVSRRWKH